MPLHRLWIVVVNEEGSRFLLRPQGNSTLVEFVDYADSCDFLSRSDEHPSDLCRSGGRVMLKARSRKHDEQLQVFLQRVARQLDEALARHPAESLTICAPPHVLNLLRDSISRNALGLLGQEICKDLVRKPVWVIDEAVGRIDEPSASLQSAGAGE